MKTQKFFAALFKAKFEIYKQTHILMHYAYNHGHFETDTTLNNLPLNQNLCSREEKISFLGECITRELIPIVESQTLELTGFDISEIDLETNSADVTLYFNNIEKGPDMNIIDDMKTIAENLATKLDQDEDLFFRR